jgi:hypothetical protein
MGFGKKQMVNVVNKGGNTYTEEFMGRKIILAPGGAVQMTRREAVAFLGTYSGMEEGKKRPIEKNLVIEYPDGKPPEIESEKKICNKCGIECQNDDDLEAHMKEQHAGESEGEKNPEPAQDGTLTCPICKKNGIKGKAGLRIHLANCKGE